MTHHPRARLAALGLTQAGLRRLLVELGDTRNPPAIARAIERWVAGEPGDGLLPIVLTLLERLHDATQAREAA